MRRLPIFSMTKTTTKVARNPQATSGIKEMKLLPRNTHIATAAVVA